MLISGVRHSKSFRTLPRYIRKRSLKNFNSNVFLEMVRQLSWFDIYCTTDVNKAVDLLTTKLSSILNEVAPMKTFQVRTNYSPWVSSETKELMKLRNNLLKLASETRDSTDWLRFKNMRNKMMLIVSFSNC